MLTEIEVLKKDREMLKALVEKLERENKKLKKCLQKQNFRVRG